MKKFDTPEVKLYSLAIRDKVSNGFNGEDDTSELPEDEFETNP